jgi:hypothetical protein
MDRRKFVVGGGAALAITGLTVQRAVEAQDATPTPSTGMATPGATQNQNQNQAQTLYQDFLTNLAKNLGVADAKTVDTAIRVSLKQLVDAQFTAGHISADTANALKTKIDSAPVPIRIGAFAAYAGEPGGRGGRQRGPHGGNKGYGKGGYPKGNEGSNENNQSKEGQNKNEPAAGATPASD